MRDPLAVDFDAADFPSDETAHGFDMIAGVLTIQPLLMERYLAAADEIVGKVLAGYKAPPPPANVPPLEETKVEKNASLRVRLEQHRANADCAVCHDKIDPAGFTLENFDAIGAWREQEGINRIEASGKFADGAKVDGAAGLKKYLKGEKFARAFAQKMMTCAPGVPGYATWPAAWPLDQAHWKL